MQRLKVVLSLEVKSDPEDVDMLEQDIRDELQALVEEEGELDYRVVEEESEEEEEEFDP